MPLVNDLTDKGVSPKIAAAFIASTAKPIQQVSENGQGESGGGSPTYQTVDGGTLTEAQIQEMITQSQAANPNAAGSNGSLFSYAGTPWTTNANGTPSDGSQTTQPQLDWSAYLSNWGFTPDIINELTSIFSKYSDPNQASAAALAYIRGTDWYQQTFPGIGTAIKLGLVNDEAGYRSYVNNLSQYYQRYYNRDATSAEVVDALTRGLSPDQVGAHFQGQAQVAAEKPQIQYELGAFDDKGTATDSELSSYGDQLAGLGNTLGPQLQQRITQAQQRLATIFQGQAATPSLSVLNNGRLATASGTSGTNTDIAS